MRKIPTLFQRDEPTHRVIDAVTPGCEWVLAGEGVPTLKVDGTAVKVAPDGAVLKRFELKAGKVAPSTFEPAQSPDVTGNTPGWVLIKVDSPEDQYLVEALRTEETVSGAPLPSGTYELLGPKVQGNPEHLSEHRLYRHGREPLVIDEFDRTFLGLWGYLCSYDMEGIVWWLDPNDDGCPKVKLKVKDYGSRRDPELPRPPIHTSL